MFRPVVSAVTLVSILAVPAAGAPGDAAWVEVKSPSFTVVSDGSEKQAREVAFQFEQVRALLKRAWPWARVDLPRPVTILAVRNEAGLRALLPGFWEDKKSAHPAGFYQNAPDRGWFALRMDVADVRQHHAARGNPYVVVFYPCVHLVLALNFRQLPAWFGVGVAEFWGNSIVESGVVYEGWPVGAHLQTLRNEAPMPLATLFGVAPGSPESREPRRANLFHAQCWALVHYLILGSDGRREEIDEYASLLRQGREEGEAAREAFGDLGVLGQELASYVRDNKGFRSRPRDTIGDPEAGFVARPLPPAESLAVRALFLAATSRSKEARALADRSLALEPGFPAAEEAIAVAAFRANQPDEALRTLDRLVTRPGASDFAHYFHAQVLRQSPAGTQSLERAEASLRRATEVNPRYAEAWADLALFGLERGAPLDPLFPYATRAIELEPDNPEYRVLALRIAARGGEVEAARTAARQMLSTVAGQDRPPVEAFLAELDVIERSSTPAAATAVPASRPLAVAPQGVPAAWGVFANPDGKADLSERDKNVEIRVPGGVYDLSPEIGQVTAPRLLRPAEGDFVAEVTIPRAPEPVDRPKASRGDSTSRFPYNGLGLLVWQDERNFVRFELAVYVPPTGAPVRYALLEWRRNGVPVAGLAPSRVRLDATRTQLRLERRGDTLQAFVRQRSAEWITVGQLAMALPTTIYVGVAAVNTSQGPLEASFTDFALSPP